MSTTLKAGWLKDSQGNKFAPKTMSSQVIKDDGTLLEDKINLDLSELRQYTNEELAKKSDKDHSHDDYITQEYADDKLVSKLDLENIDLNGYYTKEEIDNMEFITVDDMEGLQDITSDLQAQIYSMRESVEQKIQFITWEADD
jgi:hypothetical protein